MLEVKEIVTAVKLDREVDRGGMRYVDHLRWHERKYVQYYAYLPFTCLYIFRFLADLPFLGLRVLRSGLRNKLLLERHRAQMCL